ncbi:MAG: SDR family oxidoreductase [Balneolaceae bacterium]
MKVLVAGATGATGRLLVKQLLEKGHMVKVLVRSKEKLKELEEQYDNLTQIQGSALEMEAKELAKHLEDCEAVCSCLGHNLNWKGIFGKPRRLVTDSVKKLCEAVISNQPKEPVRFVLMNTNGNSNRDLEENYSTKDKAVISLLRVVLPPHVDNEEAADYLRTEIGKKNKHVEWVAVRPDNLIDEEHVSDYEINPSPVRGVIFDSGKTSRINVANFMARLTYDVGLFEQWKGQMPVINNTLE